jgi:hypothetical protein
VFWRGSLTVYTEYSCGLGWVLENSVEILGLCLSARMEAWSSRFRESRERFFEDDEEDDANMDMVVDQFQNFIPPEPPSRRAAGGSRQGRAANIERDRVIMDAQMHKDYFADRPTHGPHIFHRQYRMRRSLFVLFWRGCVPGMCILFRKGMPLGCWGCLRARR